MDDPRDNPWNNPWVQDGAAMMDDMLDPQKMMEEAAALDDMELEFGDFDRFAGMEANRSRRLPRAAGARKNHICGVRRRLRPHELGRQRLRPPLHGWCGWPPTVAVPRGALQRPESRRRGGPGASAPRGALQRPESRRWGSPHGV